MISREFMGKRLFSRRFNGLNKKGLVLAPRDALYLNCQP